MYTLKFRIKRTKTLAMTRAETRLGTKKLFNVWNGKTYRGKTVWITPTEEFTTPAGVKLAIMPKKCK